MYRSASRAWVSMARHRGANLRSVWTVATQSYSGAHFATFPPRLIEPCVLAGAPPRVAWYSIRSSAAARPAWSRSSTAVDT